MSLAHDLPPEPNGVSAPMLPAARAGTFDSSQNEIDAHVSHAAVPPAPPGPTPRSKSPGESPDPAGALLLIYADALDDLERVRIATENRVRSLVQAKGMEGTPEEARLQGLADGLRALEHGAELELKRALRTHPLGPWVKRTNGVGEKQAARLLAAIGDPYIRPAVIDRNTGEVIEPARPRTVSELWAYCGYHVLNPGHTRLAPHRCTAGVVSDPTSQSSRGSHTSTAGGVAPKRARGQKANWNATAKMRAYLVAEACMKQRSSPYRKVYDDGRAKYAEAVHHHDCVRCGPSGRPAPVGSPLSEGHKHARALRLVAKAVLKDLWLEARSLAGQQGPEIQTTGAGETLSPSQDGVDAQESAAGGSS